jgi:hypothetical protein
MFGFQENNREGGGVNDNIEVQNNLKNSDKKLDMWSRFAKEWLRLFFKVFFI